MKTVFLVLAAAFSFATVTACAADKPAKEHAAHAGKEHADKKGCGMMMGKKKGMEKGKDADAHADHNK